MRVLRMHSLEHPYAGLAVACAITFAGNSLFAIIIKSKFAERPLNILIIGGVRTLIGTLGYAILIYLLPLVSYVVAKAGGFDDRPTTGSGMFLVIYYLAIVVPVRVMEWWLLIFSLYSSIVRDRPGRGWYIAIVGTIVSFLLDILAFFGLVFGSQIFILWGL
ncbi:MAG: hypothetical protein HY286_17895 [Planctomycetes bacterium]|nr:hypothetical protein [Planctomycetota bacterium]